MAQTMATYQFAGITVRTYNPAESVASAQLIDVSNWQGAFDWNAAKAAVPDLCGGLYRVTQGLGGSGTNSPDPDAAHNHDGVADAGLHRGGYHFLNPRLPGDKQAEYFLGECDHLGIIDSDILSLDNETAGDSPTQVADCAGLFMETVVRLRPNNPRWVYSYLDFILGGNCAGLERWPLWLADDQPSAPPAPRPWLNWTGWQWGTRPVNGQQIDADAFNGTASQLSAWIASYAPGSPAKHLTDGSESLTELAHGRGMSLQGWLSLQARLGGQAAADALGGAVPKAGVPWYTTR